MAMEFVPEELPPDLPETPAVSYQCPDCEKAFSSPQSLGGHSHVHFKGPRKETPGAQLTPCMVCGMNIRRDTMRRHLTNSHPEVRISAPHIGRPIKILGPVKPRVPKTLLPMASGPGAMLAKLGLKTTEEAQTDAELSAAEVCLSVLRGIAPNGAIPVNALDEYQKWVHATEVFFIALYKKES